MMNRDRLIDQLRLHEGVEKTVYDDSEGIPTIGVGRNLRDRGLSDDEIDYLLSNDIDIVVRELDNVMPWWKDLDEVRQRVLCDLVFNLGMPRFSGFKKSISYMKQQMWDQAADELLDSKWARQVGRRAERLSEMMRTGNDF
jgi:lysozyme|tara:strand:- start:4952 stop:5374 length:423 start_codon:yes stop_codon:yes gene_type:complete